jgi:hypothetical protein
MYSSEKRGGNHVEGDNQKVRDPTCKKLKDPGHQKQEQQSQ